LDHEVYGIESVNGYRRSSPEKHPFHPLYLRPVHEERLGGYYTVFREARQASAQSGQADWQSAQFNRQRSYTSKDAYVGSEVFLSIVDDTAQPMQPGVEQLQVRALCTNRHLPLDLEPTRPGQTGGPSDFTARDMARVESIRILVGLTPPRPSFAESGTAWRAVNHLSLNYLSLVTDPRPGHPSGAEALRSLLRLYAADPGSAATKVLIDGVRSITSGPSLARSPGGGPVSFIRGINIDLTLEDKSFSGIGLFPLASVLEQFFARHVSINHFTRLTLHTPERERIMEWPARVGRIPVC
jgi:type VI secretion system protein ImpG